MRTNEPKGSKVIMINDVSRAFFEAPAVRNICVEIPPEDLEEAEEEVDDNEEEEEQEEGVGGL